METAELSISKYDTKEYKRSRGAYAMECAFEYFVTLLVGDAFLVKILQNIGMSDALIGICSSFVTLAFLFQLITVFVAHKICNTKRVVFISHIISHLFFMLLYAIPFLPIESELKQVFYVIFVFVAYFGSYFVSSILYKWGNSYVDPTKRASYSATKEMISLATGIAMTLIIGYIVDIYDAAGDIYGSFIFCAIAILIFAISELVCVMLIKNDIKPKEDREKLNFREVMQSSFGNKNFRSVIFLTVIWDVARYSVLGFLGTYRLTELAFTVGAVQVINFLGSGARFLISKPFGKFSDKHSFARGIELALLIAVVGFGINVFTTPATRYLIVVQVVAYNMCLAGTNQNLTNITYNYVDAKYFAQASAIKNSIGGVCGFVSALLAGKLLSYIQENGNTFLGIEVYGQQVLSLIACVLFLIALIFTHFVIAKQKRMVQ